MSERASRAAAVEHSDCEVIGTAQLPDASWWYTAGTVGAGVGDGVGSGVVGAGVGDGVGSGVVGPGAGPEPVEQSVEVCAHAAVRGQPCTRC